MALALHVGALCQRQVCYLFFVRRLTLIVALACLFPSLAEAQGAGEGDAPRGSDEGMSPEDPRAAQHARERFQAGMEHFEAHRYREAIHEFELAASLVPSADIWFNIARAYDELRDFEPAIEYYRRYLRDRVDPPDRQRVEQHITDLEARLEEMRQQRQDAPTTGTLRIRVNLEGAAVSIDDREVGQSPIAAPLSLSPGPHEVSVEKEGLIPFRSTVNVQAGLDTTAYADLQPATQYRAVHGTRIFTWIAGGLAVVSGGFAIGYAVAAQSEKSGWADPENPTMGELDSARSLALNSDIFLGVAIGLAVTAVVLYFIEGRAVATERVAGGDVATLRF
jgi:TolA-binding protein